MMFISASDLLLRNLSWDIVHVMIVRSFGVALNASAEHSTKYANACW